MMCCLMIEFCAKRISLLNFVPCCILNLSEVQLYMQTCGNNNHKQQLLIHVGATIIIIVLFEHLWVCPNWKSPCCELSTADKRVWSIVIYTMIVKNTHFVVALVTNCGAMVTIAPCGNTRGGADLLIMM